jgi:hypothetical protein
MLDRLRDADVGVFRAHGPQPDTHFDLATVVAGDSVGLRQSHDHAIDPFTEPNKYECELAVTAVR